jgi:hypothetical protein
MPVEAIPTESVPTRHAELSAQWLDLARASQQITMETVRRFLDTAALLTPAHLVRAEYGLVRHAVSSAVFVNVNVDVDVASRATRAVEEAGRAPAPGSCPR